MSRPCYFLVPCALLSGCLVGPHYHEPASNVPGSFASKADGAVTASVEAGWWKRLNDPLLNNLINQSDAQNLDLKVAEARIKEARALYREARYDLFPRVTSEAGYTNTRTSKARSLTGKAASSELYEGALDASWELDFFGRVRRSINAAHATEEAIAAERDALLIDLRSEVATNYLMLRGAQAELDVARQNATNQADSLRVAEASLNGGRGTQLDVARARAQWNSTLATIPQFQANIDQAAHRVAVLCGVAPSTLRAKLEIAKPLPQTPSRIALSKPADVLRHRPDIRMAERNLAAATERVGIATADLFPRVTFNGSIGLEGQTLSALGQAGNGAYSFGPRLTWAAFDLARVRQQILAADARAEGALNQYQQTVLQALEEAENALTAYERERQRLQYLREAAKSAEEAAKLARERYKDGVASFLDVLEAERVALVAQSDVVSSQTRVATAWVSIYKAMGGGWGSSPRSK
ncbi:MAG: NodT family efflux system outer rane lipoprotein [Verrucomicrobiaceae bacterium]|nr:NodT family efflux system outer rane lipoprotein [Verrucomicrobiaceae bacterium]